MVDRPKDIDALDPESRIRALKEYQELRRKEAIELEQRLKEELAVVQEDLDKAQAQKIEREIQQQRKLIEMLSTPEQQEQRVLEQMAQKVDADVPQPDLENATIRMYQESAAPPAPLSPVVDRTIISPNTSYSTSAIEQEAKKVQQYAEQYEQTTRNIYKGSE